MYGWFCFLTHGEISSGERDHSVNCLLHKMKDLSSVHSARVKSQTLAYNMAPLGKVSCAISLIIYLNSIPGTQMAKGKKRVSKDFFCICVHPINKCN